MRARSLLKKKGIKYNEISVSGDKTLWAEMEEKSGRNTVPQIFINDQAVGGYDDIAALNKADKLDSLLGLENSN
jgi:glutaredoxin 3